MRYFPIFFDVAGRRVLVAGGGTEAAAKVRLLAKSEARVEVFADELGVELRELHADGSFFWRPERLTEEVLGRDTVLIYAATGDAEADKALARLARAHRIPVNAVDQPAFCDFTTPAIVDRDPVTIAICTEGTAPVLARKLKAEIDAWLPLSLGALARQAARLRNVVAANLPAGKDRRTFWQTFFGQLEEKSESVIGSLTRDLVAHVPPLDPRGREGFVSFIGAGPGHPDLLTLKARRVLDQADIVLFDNLVDPRVLELVRREAVQINVGKRDGEGGKSQGEINAAILSHASSGRHVVRLKGGDPNIFGRLAEELDTVVKAGIGFEVVPGITSASAAAAAAAAPLTERGLGSEVRVVTAHGRKGFASLNWADLGSSDAPVAVYMGLKLAADVQQALIVHGRKADTPVILIQNVARDDEKRVDCRLDQMADTITREELTGPVIMLIGANSRAPLSQISKQLKEVA